MTQAKTRQVLKGGFQNGARIEAVVRGSDDQFDIDMAIIKDFDKADEGLHNLNPSSCFDIFSRWAFIYAGENRANLISLDIITHGDAPLWSAEQITKAMGNAGFRYSVPLTINGKGVG